MPTVVHTEGVTRKMQAIANVLHRPLQDVLEQGAHVVAINCARVTQPFGTGRAAQEMGEKAVAKDIAKVYKTPGAVWEDIRDNAGSFRFKVTTFLRGGGTPDYYNKTGPAGAYWKAIKTGNFEHAQLIQNAYSRNYHNVPLQKFDGGAAHKAARSTRRSGGGRGLVSLSRPVMIVTNPDRLARYVKQIQGNVGFAKGGWADVASILGSRARGLKEKGGIGASWISRKAHGFGRVSYGGSKEEPTITLENTVPYVDQLFTGKAKREAIRIGQERMIKYLATAVKEEIKKLRAAA